MLASEPLETIHIYYERNDEPDETPEPFIKQNSSLALLACLCFVVVMWLVCSIPPVLQTVVISAHLLPPKHLSVSIIVVPTGLKTSSATNATGSLTVYNGSFLAELIPQGLILVAHNGVEVTTDTSVMVPAANPPAYGMATVMAHALVSGSRGNVASGQIASIENTSLFIRNLTPFHGGQDASRFVYTTIQDEQRAVAIARSQLGRLVLQSMLDKPCNESRERNRMVWTCQYVTYTFPSFFRVVGVEIRGQQVLVYGFALARPQRSVPR